jgi:hypothetical protein
LSIFMTREKSNGHAVGQGRYPDIRRQEPPQ